MFAFMSGHVTGAEEGPPREHARGDEWIRVHGVILQQRPPKFQRPCIISNVDRDYRTLRVTQLEAHPRQFIPHISVVLPQLIDPPGLFLHHIERGHRRGDTGWRTAGRKHEGRRKMLYVIQHLPLSHEVPTDTCQGLAERATDQIDIVLQSEVVRGSEPSGSDDAKSVRVIHEESRAVLLDHRNQLVEFGDVALGAEHAIRHHEGRFGRFEL